MSVTDIQIFPRSAPCKGQGKPKKHDAVIFQSYIVASKWQPRPARRVGGNSTARPGGLQIVWRLFRAELARAGLTKPVYCLDFTWVCAWLDDARRGGVNRATAFYAIALLQTAMQFQGARGSNEVTVMVLQDTLEWVRSSQLGTLRCCGKADV